MTTINRMDPDHKKRWLKAIKFNHYYLNVEDNILKSTANPNRFSILGILCDINTHLGGWSSEIKQFSNGKSCFPFVYNGDETYSVLPKDFRKLVRITSSVENILVSSKTTTKDNYIEWIEKHL